MKRQYFGTDGIRGRVGDAVINPEFVLKLGWAVGKVLAREGDSKVLIGKDTRISGYMLESALEAGLSAAGVDIHLLGPIPTPGIAYLTQTLHAQAGIVISASHNPYYDNGIKFFSSLGRKLDDNLEEQIEMQLRQPMRTAESVMLGKAVRIEDAAGRYIEFCKSTMPGRASLKGFKIVVDCANGATYHIAPNVFQELGATVIETGVAPDGFNINHDCGSTEPHHLKQLVLDTGADLGIALDGDGDRLIMVDADGESVDGDEILFIMARHTHQIGKLQGGVVGTVMSNLGLEHAFDSLGIPFLRSKVGDRHVLDKLQEKSWQIGGESSGHILHLGLTTTGDGIVSAIQVLAVMLSTGQSLAELKQGMTKYPQSLLNVSSRDPKKAVASKPVQDAVLAAESTLAGRGRVLIRPSGTEPVVRVMVEGEDLQEVGGIAEALSRVVEQSD